MPRKKTIDSKRGFASMDEDERRETPQKVAAKVAATLLKAESERRKLDGRALRPARPDAKGRKARSIGMANQNQNQDQNKQDQNQDNSKRGFASMDEDKQREIASKGGQSVPDEKRSFSQDPELASEAGKKGGEESGGNFKNDPERAAEAGKKGGDSRGS